MKNSGAGTLTPTGTKGGRVADVEVKVDTIDGKLKCTPDHVVIFGGETVGWIFGPGGHAIEFEVVGPFGQQRHEETGAGLILGPHKCKDRELFKYTITAPGFGAQDPVVDADPRKRPRLK